MGKHFDFSTSFNKTKILFSLGLRSGLSGVYGSPADLLCQVVSEGRGVLEPRGAVRADKGSQRGMNGHLMP